MSWSTEILKHLLGKCLIYSGNKMTDDRNKENWKTKGQAGVPSVKLRFLKYSSIGWAWESCTCATWGYDGLVLGIHCAAHGSHTLTVNAGCRVMPVCAVGRHFPDTLFNLDHIWICLPAACQAGLRHPLPSSPSFSQSFLVVASILLFSVSLKSQMNTMEHQHIS